MGRGEGAAKAGAVVAAAPRRQNPVAKPAAGKAASKARGKKTKLSEEAKAKKRAKVEQALKDLETRVSSMTVEDYNEFLRQVGKGGLWKYSARNLTLILMQKQNATRVASYNGWQKQGRQVKKGSVGAVILRPQTAYVSELDENGQPKLDENGKPKKRKRIIHGQFGLGSVFDISDTEPKQGVTQAPDLISRSSDQCADDLTRIAQQRGIKVFRGGVEDEDFPYRQQLNIELLKEPNAGGYYVHAEIPRKAQGPEVLEAIVTRKDLSAQEEARVIAHELGHAMLHRDNKDLDPRVKEVEAEAVGYALCSDYGIETDYSAAYIMNWSQSKDEPTRELQASMERIRKAVKSVFELREEEEATS